MSGDKTEGRRADQFLAIPGGRIAYDDTGTGGPLVVLSHGMGNTGR